MAFETSGTESLTGVPSRTQCGRAAVIEVRGVSKTFRIPSRRVDSLKERAVNPFSAVTYHDLEALKDVAFDVERGEMFGIVGRNGSGKSTLLKILASIYSSDSGSIRMAGAVAPFIELGVGFNPELTARENIVLNGVMMGLSRREARRRVGSVLDFAELEEFAELKLKNYSSGMTVRLAFAVMIQSEAEILLIDEVLAVGDAAFQQKCATVFAEMRDDDRTVVLVTHDMSAVDAYCHRAMLLERGRVAHLGDPDAVAQEYIATNLERRTALIDDTEFEFVAELLVRVVKADLRTGDGRGETIRPREPIRVRLELEALAELRELAIRFEVRDGSGSTMLSVPSSRLPAPETLPAGGHAVAEAELGNPLGPGRYGLFCWVAVPRGPNSYRQQSVKLFEFEVVQPETVHGPGAIPDEVRITLKPQGGDGA